MSHYKLPGRFKLLGSMALLMMVFMTGGAFADELLNAPTVTPDIMDKFTNLGLAILIAHMWSKDAENKHRFIKTLFDEHKEEKSKLLDMLKDWRTSN